MSPLRAVCQNCASVVEAWECTLCTYRFEIRAGAREVYFYFEDANPDPFFPDSAVPFLLIEGDDFSCNCCGFPDEVYGAVPIRRLARA
jgi:hypothetical protein